MKRILLDLTTALFCIAVVITVVLFSTSGFTEFIYSNF